jgi:hypothetical protein
MTRLTQRLSTMFSAVKCPRCGMLVQPDSIPSAKRSPDAPVQGDDEKRWSFLWVAPRGDVCPECEFPLSKYFGRLKWIRTAAVGVFIVMVSLLFQIIGSIGQLGTAFVRIWQTAILFGAVVAAIGIVGVIVGGRHRTVRVSGR